MKTNLPFQWCGAAIVFWLPTLLWRGAPIPENPSGKSGDPIDEYDNYYGKASLVSGFIEVCSMKQVFLCERAYLEKGPLRTLIEGNEAPRFYENLNPALGKPVFHASFCSRQFYRR